ncbi:SRPBCC family protein [Haladaptatus sp. ZSTT2]|uniref:SRPBCC family protein n=1 Tax=Haladaptatus sp. ZSTT2 TaxID=3120515 RepID=UPI00300F0DD2
MTNKASRGIGGGLIVSVSNIIDRPVSDVFHFIADQHVENHPRWDPDIELEQESDGSIEVGTIIRRRNTRYDTPVEGTMEITEFERNQAMGSIIREGGFEMQGRITFEDLGLSQTRITQQASVPDSIDEALIRQMMERSSATIKELLESAE